MKKIFILLCAILTATFAQAQESESQWDYLVQQSLKNITADDGDVFGIQFNQNDSLFFRITDATQNEVEVSNCKMAMGSMSIDIPSTVEYEGDTYTVTAIGGRAFFNQMTLRNITIPNTVTELKEEAFSVCMSLQNFELPSSVTTLGRWAIYSCMSLTSMNIPASVTSIDGSIFSGCMSLATITVDPANPVYDSRNNCNAIMETATDKLIAGCTYTTVPSNTKILGDEAFMLMFNMQSINLPNGLLEIGKHCFVSTKIASLTLPNTLTTLDDEALLMMTELRTIYIPASVTHIGKGQLATARALELVVVDAQNPVYDSRSNCNCIILTDSNMVVSGCATSVVPEGIVSIGESSFVQLVMPEGWSLPNTVTRIDPHAFKYTHFVESFEVPENVTKLDTGVFNNSYVSKVILPAGLTTIAPEALLTDYLEEIVCKAVVAPDVDTTSFYEPMDVTIPCGSLESYQTKWGNLLCDFLETPGQVTVLSDNEFLGTANIDEEASCVTGTATISATPNAGFRFAHWNDDNTENPRVVNVTSDTTFVAFFELMSGVDEYEGTEVVVTSMDRNICVVGEEGSLVSIYDMTGRIVAQDRLHSGKNFPMSKSGIYIVRVGEVTKKVVVF